MKLNKIKRELVKAGHGDLAKEIVESETYNVPVTLFDKALGQTAIINFKQSKLPKDVITEIEKSLKGHGSGYQYSDQEKAFLIYI